MKTILALLVLGCVAQAAEMTARFRNGDSVHGRLLEVGEDRLLWDSPSFFSPQPLQLTELVDILLPPALAPELPAGDHIATLTLTNGDSIQGSLVGVDDTEIRLLTSFAGELVFRRTMVEGLEIEKMPTIFFSGPRSLDDWKLSHPGAWSYDDGRLVSHGHGGVAREFGAPSRSRLAFDVDWRGSVRFRVLISADNLDESEIRNGYEMICQPERITFLKRYEQNGQVIQNAIGNTTAVREFQEQEKTRIELLQDVEAGRFQLLIDGRMIGNWRDPAPEAGKLGTSVHFLCEQEAPLSISRIQLSSWDSQPDGQDPELAPFEQLHPLDDESEAEESTDSSPTPILLANGDRIEGKALGIGNHRVTIETTYKTFELPVSRVRSFALRTPEEAADPELTWKPRRRAGDIRASFTNGGHLTFELVGLGDTSLRGRSQTFGEAEFDLGVFSRLEFNLYRPNLPEP